MNQNGQLQGTSTADFVKGESHPRLNAEAKKRYSEVLTDLVTECTKYWPKERIGLKELLARIEANTGTKTGKKKKGTGVVDLAQGYAKR